ncbi:hypothetical protein C923_02667 [Plasmodium falciparum UGT5.1]|uniref:Uncharacterized protein n=1 Tax=Plasmodium falciparum UGT5.1 TaxID=1237627 RepID=W7JCL7_PLAFA|nr:hypothetical protein C923_02667 [Plasmodium falciparum UGT5.1]
MEKNAEKKKKNINKKISIFEKRHDDEHNFNAINNMQKKSNENNNNHAVLKNDQEKIPLYFTNGSLNSSHVENSLKEDENINEKKKKKKKKKTKNVYIESNNEYNQNDEKVENISSEFIKNETQEINGKANLINGKKKNVINNENVLLTLNTFDIKKKNKDTITLSKKKQKINKENKKKLLQNKLKQKKKKHHNVGKNSVKDICEKNNVVRKTILKKGKSKSTVTKKYIINKIKNYFDILNKGRETEIYFENNNYIVDNDQKYILFLMSIQPPLFFTLICYFILFIFILIALNIYLPKHCEFFIPSFLLNNTKFIETFEKMRKKKIIVSSIMFLAYNIIYSILCNTNEIHVYQNKNLIYKDYFNEYFFIQTLRTNLKNIHK